MSEVISYQDWVENLNVCLHAEYGDHLDASDYPSGVLEQGFKRKMSPSAFFSWSEGKRFEDVGHPAAGSDVHRRRANGTSAKLFGALILGASVLAFLNVKPQLDQVHTLGGQAALVLGGLVSRGPSDVQAQVQSWQLTYNLSLVGMLVGALVLIVGFVQDLRPD